MRIGAPLEGLGQKLCKIHFLRLGGLVENLERECREHLQGERDAPATEKTATLEAQPSDSNFAGGITNQLQTGLAKGAEQRGRRDSATGQTDEQLLAALRIVCQILSLNKDKIKREIKGITVMGEEPTPQQTLDTIIAEYWGPAEQESWMGWYIKAVVMTSWESEDQFFPGLVNLLVQKVYLDVEYYLPWIVIGWDQFHLDSVWFLLVAVMTLGISVMIDRSLANEHEYTTVAKGTLIVLIPLCVLFFQHSIMTLSQLVWSMVLYLIGFSLLLRIFFGVVNAVAKKQSFGWAGNPFHQSYAAFEASTERQNERVHISVKNRTQEMEMTNDNEVARWLLFTKRLRFIRFVTIFRNIVPLITAALLIIGNAITVVLSEWITTLNFNGRVNEAWKKAYLRPSVANTAQIDWSKQGGGGAPGASEPLTRMREHQQEDAWIANAAVSGTINSSLPSAASRRSSNRSNKNFMSSKAIPAPGAPQSKSVMSVGSMNEDPDGLGDRLLASEATRNDSLLSAPTNRGLHFLNYFGVKGRESTLSKK